MKKIRLNLDHVEVESFLTVSPPRPQANGTVVANVSSRPGATYCGCTSVFCTAANLC